VDSRNHQATPQALPAFRDTYNTTRPIQRHGFITPEAFRQKQLQTTAKAA
jgi:hypothetical protein